MDRKLLLETINKNEYDFLRTDERLASNIGLLTLGGSHAYGTNIDNSSHTSDIDLRGFYVHTPREILTMKYEDKPFENKELDVSIYPLKMLVNLLYKCNPNVLEILGTKDKHIAIISYAGRLLMDNKDLFLSQLAYGSFGGYATQQLRRLENALARGEYPQAEKERHILKALNSKLVTFEERFTKFDENSIKLFTEKSNKAGMDKEIYMDIHLENYPLRDFKGIYEEMYSVVKDFDKLNHRNSKKDETHLYKHAMHLIRLLITGAEILEGKGINTYREDDKDFLVDIRMKKYTYEEIFEMANKYEEKFEYAKKHTCLPVNPDTNKIDDLFYEIMKNQLKNSL